MLEEIKESHELDLRALNHEQNERLAKLQQETQECLSMAELKVREVQQESDSLRD